MSGEMTERRKLVRVEVTPPAWVRRLGYSVAQEAQPDHGSADEILDGEVEEVEASAKTSNQPNPAPGGCMEEPPPPQLKIPKWVLPVVAGLLSILAVVLGAFIWWPSSAEDKSVEANSTSATSVQVQEYFPGGTGIRVERSVIGGDSSSAGQAMSNQLKAPLIIEGNEGTPVQKADSSQQKGGGTP